MSFRAAFVTIGQSPRSDMLAEIFAHTRTKLAVTERGALDGLNNDKIAALTPKPNEPRLITRLRDGRDVIVGKPAIDDRLRVILAELDNDGFDLLVLLCTGHLERFRTRTPFLQAQHVVDYFVQGIAGDAARVGVVLPSSEQTDGFHGLGDLETKLASASPFASDQGAALREVGAALADADMHGFQRGDAGHCKHRCRTAGPGTSPTARPCNRYDTVMTLPRHELGGSPAGDRAVLRLWRPARACICRSQASAAHGPFIELWNKGNL